MRTSVSAASKSVSLSKTSVTLKGGKTYNLTIKKAKNITIKSKAFATSNKNVATVAKTGKITAKKAGSATITANVKWVEKSGKKVKSSKLKCKVTVQKVTPGTSKTAGLYDEAGIKEGHIIIQKGRTNIKYYVKDYEQALFVL